MRTAAAWLPGAAIATGRSPMKAVNDAIRGDRSIVTASDIGSFAYDPEKWMREQRTGPSAADTAAMLEGTLHHERVRERYLAQQRETKPSPAISWLAVAFLVAVAITCFLAFRFGLAG